MSIIENGENNPLDSIISTTISENSDKYVKEQWEKALERRATDPEGAITTARTLLEATCKYILDSFNISYEEDIELPKLYHLTASQLNLAPQNHQEEIFKQILGGCQSVINGLGSLRNKIGDAHGKGIRHIKPLERHAKLAVNLAGTLSSFLIDTFNQRKKIKRNSIMPVKNTNKAVKSNPEKTPIVRNCSFCGKSSEVSRRLIAGPNNIFICDDCVSVCVHILSEELGLFACPFFYKKTSGSLEDLGSQLSIAPNKYTKKKIRCSISFSPK